MQGSFPIPLPLLVPPPIPRPQYTWHAPQCRSRNAPLLPFPHQAVRRLEQPTPQSIVDTWTYLAANLTLHPQCDSPPLANILTRPVEALPPLADVSWPLASTSPPPTAILSIASHPTEALGLSRTTPCHPLCRVYSSLILDVLPVLNGCPTLLPSALSVPPFL
ncbi:hypothetical protein AMTR_s00160p00065100 [Amborella trichopoda]|uniref:Uncharacterized protein n=1 Tax=Amborella trichopoda TaxID=13333 RepID=W1PLT3_AMBTC|nr:hypothetical protein AMTR_s00160p00065100 [Amborella trichopoda]